MESKNRNVWIILAVIVVLLCCAALLVAALAVGLFAARPFDWSGATGLHREGSDQAFIAGDAPSLRIDNLAGDVTVRTGESGVIRVAATKNARREGDLDRIELEITERDGGLVIETKKPAGLNSVSVDLEITTPADTSLDVLNGAGDVDIDGITGEIDVQSGAGDLGVSGGAGSVRLDTGAGDIRYQGNPRGEFRFETGAGDIRLTLPADLNVKVDLETGIGNIEVGFSVEGQVSGRTVRGVIGSGAQGSIYARSGAGDIDVISR